MALKILLVSLVSCGMCLPAMADSIPTVNATYFNVTSDFAGYFISGGAAGDVSITGGGRLGSTTIFPAGASPRDWSP